MKVKLVSYSTPSLELSSEGLDDMQDLVAFCARVSNPTNQMNTETSERLLKYLMKNKHWSPFEMTSVCLEIETTRDIARQLLRHRSFSFQEFCLSGDSEIYTTHPTDSKTKLSLLYKVWKTSYGLPNHQLKIYDENSNSFVSAKIVEIFSTGKKPVYKVTFNDGKSIKTTKEHKFLTKDGFASLDSFLFDYSDIQIGTTELIQCCNQPKWTFITNIEYVGEEDTYDIEVDHSSHNYVANGIVVHNSQRYANPVEELFFELREARLQDTKNRQNSIITNDETLQQEWNKRQQEVIDKAKEAYSWAIENGIAKEQARAVLPEGNTMSRLYVNGTIRSWIHYCELRGSNGTQKEHMDVAHACADVIAKLFPLINIQ
jgi:thymidylate synthase ThyX